MASTLVQIRVDEDLKNEATDIFERLGLDLPTAIRVFLKKSVEESGIPFNLKIDKNKKVSLKQGQKAFKQLRKEAKKNGLQDMSLDEINAEIKEYRQERRAALALVVAGIDINGDEGLGLVDHEIAAALELDLAIEGVMELALDAEALEDVLRTLVAAHLALGTAGNAARDVTELLKGPLVVHQHVVDVLGEPVAHDALDEIGFLPHAAGRAEVLDVALQLVPALEQVAHVAHEGRSLGADAGGANDETDFLSAGQQAIWQSPTFFTDRVVCIECRGLPYLFIHVCLNAVELV